ncbi:MAG: sigma 54-interacting transcriptional regulator [Deltaproteobacteria bacterium]|nr:sigma 54-interacting transcriptional regulator [Deltaproteobacteria bacterium]
MASPSRPEDCPGWQDTILESIADGVFAVDPDWRITYFNRAAEDITGVMRDEALGRHCWEVFHADVCGEGCVLRRTLSTGQPQVNQAAYIVRQDGERIPISMSTAVLRDESGTFVGGVETFRSLAEVETLRKELERRYSFGDIVSKNKRMQEILDILPQVALSDASVLIEGESGTGKELVARALHNLSRRRDGPLITVNCGALPDGLLESELFGHVAGAFTDARQNRPGRFQLADGGTIFLDEIGDISPALQVRLLRVLQEHSFEPLGSSSTVEVDVRVLAASNKNLAALVDSGAFRDDLFYRINVVHLVIPPLRERREDIPLLVEHFIGHFNQIQGKEVSRMSKKAMGLLMSHPFPGNVRELRNAIEHAFVLCPGGVLLPEHLPEAFRDKALPSSAKSAAGPTSLQEMEGKLLREALARNGFNRSRTARELGIHKTTLWRKMKRLGIELPEK